jgi:hypothetical protein
MRSEGVRRRGTQTVEQQQEEGGGQTQVVVRVRLQGVHCC